MPTEIELLPLPEGYEKYDPPLLYEGKMFHEGQMRAYARANVTHATAALQAEVDALRTRLEDTVRDSTNEIEALRAEVAAWRELSDHVRVGACAAIWPDRYTDERIRDVAAALKRAERLAEALRRYGAHNETCVAMDIPFCTCGLDAALREQEEGHEGK